MLGSSKAWSGRRSILTTCPAELHTTEYQLQQSMEAFPQLPRMPVGSDLMPFLNATNASWSTFWHVVAAAHWSPALTATRTISSTAVDPPCRPAMMATRSLLSATRINSKFNLNPVIKTQAIIRFTLWELSRLESRLHTVGRTNSTYKFECPRHWAEPVRIQNLGTTPSPEYARNWSHCVY